MVLNEVYLCQPHFMRLTSIIICAYNYVIYFFRFKIHEFKYLKYPSFNKYRIYNFLNNEI